MLVIATVFSAFSSFMGSVYFLEKKSLLSMLTAASGAIINVVLNFLMIPRHGAMGAAVATLISYLAVYVIRAIDTGNYLKFNLSPVKVTVNTLVLILQAVIMIESVRYWQYAQIGIIIFMLLFNGKGILHSVFQILSKKSNKI